MPNHFYIGKTISITYSDFVSAAFFMQHAKRMRHITLLSVWFYHICPHYLKNGTIFGKNAFERKVCCDFSLRNLSEIRNSDSQKNSARHRNECTCEARMKHV